MKVIVLHLSDIHLKSAGNAIFDKLDKIKGTINVHGDIFGSVAEFVGDCSGLRAEIEDEFFALDPGLR